MATNQRLLSIVERIEQIEEEKRGLSAAIADIKVEARSAGFEVKAINQMLRERRMSEQERCEFWELTELYRAALGMLGGGSLSDAARKRLSEPPKPPGQDATDAAGATAEEPSDGAEASAPVDPEQEARDWEEEIRMARHEGGEAALGGAKVIDNPWPFGDPRRGAWDEGWCSAVGSDGMDIPAAWRRAPKKTPDSEESAP